MSAKAGMHFLTDGEKTNSIKLGNLDVSVFTKLLDESKTQDAVDYNEKKIAETNEKLKQIGEAKKNCLLEKKIN